MCVCLYIYLYIYMCVCLYIYLYLFFVIYIYFSLFNVSICFTNNQVQRIYTINFYIINIFHCDVSNVINISIFI